MAINFISEIDPQQFQLNQSLLRARLVRLLRLLEQSGRTISVVFLDDKEMARYNQTYRHKEGPTNVLSFPADVADELGDILISVDTAWREAVEKEVPLHQHLTWLIIHGLLHLLGYDHELSEAEAERMQDKEAALYQAVQHIHSGGRTMPQLAINVDHIATIREARGGAEPDPVLAAGICELAGARGIVVHLREDRRHIQERDVRVLRQTVKTRLNLEMAAVKEIVEIALDVRPDLITLVPEKRKELTTEGGLDIPGNEKKIRKTVGKMTEAGIPVSIFIDPDEEQIKAAADVGAAYVELHTGRYADAKDHEEQEREFRLIEQAAEIAYAAGLWINAGHGLNYLNVGRVAGLSVIEELSIGHAIIARAAFVGLDKAVREMQNCIDLAV
ncbi:pyridoxine 5'-phosphate synthase [Candidatus Electronema sp. JC]|uniref:pyridoxine 5'-phosphate synthase n=1 Tax=Candidatus Electronema sp. JC TaxID=3401570 RepID=UPI003B438D29